MIHFGIFAIFGLKNTQNWQLWMQAGSLWPGLREGNGKNKNPQNRL